MATAESLNNVLEMFKSLDVDGDGKLTAQELKSSKNFFYQKALILKFNPIYSTTNNHC